jgi:hypothetical protein
MLVSTWAVTDTTMIGRPSPSPSIRQRYHDDHVTTRPAGDRADSHTNGHWHAVGNHEAQADGLTLAGQHTLILSIATASELTMPAAASLPESVHEASVQFSSSITHHYY